MEEMNKKICGQVSIPTTDNNSPCTSFMPLECVILDDKKRLVRTYPGETLSSYITKLENEFRSYKAKLKMLENKVEILINNSTPTP